MKPKIAIRPQAIDPAGSGVPRAGSFEDRVLALTRAIEAGGGTLVEPSEADGLVWLLADDPHNLIDILKANPTIRWVQLPWAGVEHFLSANVFDRDVVFTNAKEIFAPSVAEHAFGLIVATLRHWTKQARTPHWNELEVATLYEKNVTVVGGGGIGKHLIPYLQAANTRITVVNRSGKPLANVNRTVSLHQLDEVLPTTDVLVLCLPLTPETEGIIGEKQLSLLPNHAFLINVARGKHVDTQALIQALNNNQLAGAGLDVTDPEPLPDDSPLWQMDNVLITSHDADPSLWITKRLSERVQRNVELFAQGKDLEGVVDPKLGY